MATTFLGLTIPVGGITPDAANNTTPGTYPYIIAADLNLIDSLCYSLNNPVPTAGININANLPFNGYSITGLGALTATGTVTTSGTLSGPTIQFDTANSYTSGGTISISPNVASGGVAAILLNSVAMSSGYLLKVQNTGEAGPINAVTIDYAGNIVASGSLTTDTNLVVTTTAAITGAATFGSTVGVVGAIKETTGSTALKLEGNAAATSGTGCIINNITAQTSGKIISFQAGASSGEVANIGYDGSLNLVELEINATTGHMIPTGSSRGGTTPTVVLASPSGDGSWGTGPSVAVTGGDLGFQVIVTAEATPTTFDAATAMFTITLSEAYASTAFVAVGSYGGSSDGLSGITGLTCVNVYTGSTGATFIVYCNSSFTPVATNTYVYNFITMGAGAAS